MLAPPGLRRNLRPLLLGTLGMAVAEVLLLLITAWIVAHKTLAQLLQSQDAVAGWFLHFGDYLAVDALPYLIPFAVAIWLHRELREQMFHWVGAAAEKDAARRSSTRSRK